MIPLFGDDGPPRVGELAPDVRSGTTFTYTGSGNVADNIQFVLIVWIYTIDPGKQAEFALKVNQFESDPQQLPSGSGVAGVDYRGTYSVSVSSASPDFEYRTFWGLEDLGKIKDLNDYLRQPLGKLQAVLGLIAKRPPLRAEIMGLTRNSAPIGGTTSS
jgi:hypothetical protein